MQTKEEQKVELYDTTLRDGTQSGDVNLSIHDKIKIVQALDNYGIDYIELGWPYASEDEFKCFMEASKLKLKNSKISAFGSTRRIKLKAEDDPNLRAIVRSKAKVASIFGKTWILHVEKQLKCTPEQNLVAIEDSIRFLKKNKIKTFYDAEHFFDGFKDNQEYALATLKAAEKGGADCLILCDTNGGTLSSEMIEILKFVKESTTVPFGVHLHNDSGLAVANSIISVQKGASQIQGTMNGFGERTGNADLCQIIPNLKIKLNYKFPKIKLKDTKKISKIIYTLSGIKENNAQPFVGKNSFSHKGGIHVDAIEKIGTHSYEHINPEEVGNRRQIVLSDLSGKANIVRILRENHINCDSKDPRILEIRLKVEEMFNQGYNLDLKAERKLMLERFFGKNRDFFKIINWKIMSEFRNKEEYSECVLVGKVGNEIQEVVASLPKRGPVDSTYKALQKLLQTKFPKIKRIHLQNYKVRMAKEREEESPVSVFIEFSNENETWACEGISTNILEASLEAIKKGFKYFLIK